jgi:hypothetical protein
MYSRSKEDSMEEAFIRNGFKLIEDTGRRKKHRADRILYNDTCDVTLAVDHKSTTNKESFRITKEMLDKIKLEAGKDQIPIITFSLYDMQRIYVVIEIDNLGIFTR